MHMLKCANLTFFKCAINLMCGYAFKRVNPESDTNTYTYFRLSELLLDYAVHI